MLSPDHVFKYEFTQCERGLEHQRRLCNMAHPPTHDIHGESRALNIGDRLCTINTSGDDTDLVVLAYLPASLPGRRRHRPLVDRSGNHIWP